MTHCNCLHNERCNLHPPSEKIALEMPQMTEPKHVPEVSEELLRDAHWEFRDAPGLTHLQTLALSRVLGIALRHAYLDAAKVAEAFIHSTNPERWSQDNYGAMIHEEISKLAGRES